MKLKILQYPNEQLRQVARAVDVGPEGLEPYLQDIKNLRDTFRAAHNCIGLAAPQIGIPLRIIIVDITLKFTETYLMINPVIVKEGAEQQSVRDGCMSVRNGQWFERTKRPKRLTVEWREESGAIRRQKFSGLLAAVIHHEVDHLNGVLFIDRLEAGRLPPPIEPVAEVA